MKYHADITIVIQQNSKVHRWIRTFIITKVYPLTYPYHNVSTDIKTTIHINVEIVSSDIVS